jgi:putative transposase
MATTFTSLLLHITFSTKNRAHLIAAEIEPKLHAYLGGIAGNLESPVLCIGGTSNHVHMLVSLSKKVTVVDFLETVKKESSKWMKTQGVCFHSFYWQEGYGAFSIGQSGVDALKAYIGNQKQHHQATTFEEEFLALLRKYNIPFDERYIWR